MKIRLGRLAWSIFVVLYLGLFFWNFFITTSNRWVPTLYLYILIGWLSLEFYFRQSFFQSGRLITEDPETKDRYHQMNFALRSGFALFFYSCLALGIADYVWLRKGQVTMLAPWVNIVGMLLLGASVLIRVRADLAMFKRRHKIIRDGLYASVRHPAYFGAVLLVVSIPFAFSSFLALLYAAVVGLPLIYLEASFEDRYLAGKNGDDYQEYAVGTNLFIPGIF